MSLTNTILKLDLNSKKLFIIDGIGALVSAFMLGVVLVAFQIYIGIPKPTLYLLAALPCLFAIYDFYCYNSITKNITLYLKGIAYANISYCFLSLGLVLFHFKNVTFIGWTYIIVEIIVVLGIATLELNVANKPEVKIKKSTLLHSTSDYKV